jgi:hypothetical protein
MLNSWQMWHILLAEEYSFCNCPTFSLLTSILPLCSVQLPSPALVGGSWLGQANWHTHHPSKLLVTPRNVMQLLPSDNSKYLYSTYHMPGTVLRALCRLTLSSHTTLWLKYWEICSMAPIHTFRKLFLILKRDIIQLGARDGSQDLYMLSKHSTTELHTCLAVTFLYIPFLFVKRQLFCLQDALICLWCLELQQTFETVKMDLREYSNTPKMAEQEGGLNLCP